MYKFSISLDPELIEKMDKVVELLDLKSREELIQCAVRRFVDQYHSPDIEVDDRDP